MNILYIGYWGANEGLSQATINPHLVILKSFGIDQIFYTTIERNGDQDFNLPNISGLVHIPFYTDSFNNRVVNKLYDFLVLPRKLKKIVEHNHIKLIICRSSLAGYYGNYLHKKLGIPFCVESFEPHADYMIDAMIWSRKGISSFFQFKWEQKQKENAMLLMPVSNNYKDVLIREGIDSNRIQVVPCAVDIQKFSFNEQLRISIREQLQVEDGTVIGIYVGKFGGIYYSLEESIEMFKIGKELFRKFHVIILTPQDSSEIQEKALEEGLNKSDLTIKSVSHEQVASYLSAGDFAYSLHKPTESMSFVSPIKNGEYWANGLPILISEGIGDDAKIIQESESAGAIMKNSLNSLNLAYMKIREIIQSNKSRNGEIAEQNRSFDLVENCYRSILERVKS